MTTVWHIELLGGLRGHCETGAKFAPGVSRAGMLFASLVLAPDRSLTREYLATLLWPESDEAAARARLRQELSVLRRQLEPEGVPEGSVLLRERDRIALVPGAVRTDVEQFLALLEKARTANEERGRLFTKAIELYRGELLPGYDYEGLAQERTHLAQRCEMALRELAAIQQARGNYSGAEFCLQRLITRNPYLEEAHTDLMRLYAMQGQPTRVREQYRELERILRKEFHTEPSENIRLLVERLCRDVPVSTLVLTPLDRGPEDLPGMRTSSDVPSSSHSQAIVAVPNRPLLPPLTGSRAPKRPKHRSWRSGIVALVLLCCLGLLGFYWKSRRSTALTATAPGNMFLEWGHESWVYAYQPQPGEMANSDARAMVLVGQNLFVTGLIQTEKEDTDMLTLKLSPQGKLLKRDRYSGPAHDCDRAFSISAGPQGGVYVAGESYVPARPGVSEGWRAVVIRYDANLKRLWVRQSNMVTKEGGDEGVQVLANARDGCWVGGTSLTNGVRHLMLLRYDSTGRLLWSRTVTHESDFKRMRNDGDTLYACGDSLLRDSLGLHSDWMVVRFDRNGKQIWNTSIKGPGLGGTALDLNLQVTALYVGGIFHLGEHSPGGPGLSLGVAQLEAENGEINWTKPKQQAYPIVAYSGLNKEDLGVLEVGQCTLPDHTIQIALARYNLAGDRLWGRMYNGPPGYSGVVGAKCSSWSTLGLALTPPHSPDMEYGDLLALTIQNPGSKDQALAFRPLGSKASAPRAIEMADGSQGYMAAQSQLSDGRALTVTQFHTR